MLFGKYYFFCGNFLLFVFGAAKSPRQAKLAKTKCSKCCKISSNLHKKARYFAYSLANLADFCYFDTKLFCERLGARAF